MQKADVITTAIVVTGMIGVYALVAKFARVQNELEVIPTASVHKFDLKGLTLRIDLAMKNPTSASFKIKFPYIKLYYKDSIVGSSQVVNKDITIPAYGQAVIEKIMLDVQLANLLTTAATIITAIQKKEPVKVIIKTVTAVITGVKDLSIEKTQEITVKN